MQVVDILKDEFGMQDENGKTALMHAVRSEYIDDNVI